jgi:hypothetical protein
MRDKDATNLIVCDKSKPALKTWGAGGVETISYYRTRALTWGEDKMRDW